jgi:RHS repeat-associated protein
MARVLRYVMTDAMGSVMSVLSSTGEVLERRSYDAFGKMTCMLPDGTPVATSPTGLKVGFHGQLLDQLTGMYQMGYRWYLPVLGRWVSRDPIGFEGGVNLYNAFGNAPLDMLDPWGQAGVELTCPELGSDDFSNKVPTQLPVWLGNDDTVIKEGSNHRRWNWRRVIAGNRTIDVDIVLSSGCSLTVVFHGCRDVSGCPDAKRNIEDIIKLIKAALAKHSVYCPKGPCSITLASCYGAVNGNASAIASATGLPVISATGEVNARYQNRESTASAVLYVDSVPYEKRGHFDLGIPLYSDDVSDFINTGGGFKSPDKSMQWVVIKPNSAETAPKK